MSNMHDISTWNINHALIYWRWLILPTVGVKYMKLYRTNLKFLIIVYDKRSRSNNTAKIKYKKCLSNDHFKEIKL